MTFGVSKRILVYEFKSQTLVPHQPGALGWMRVFVVPTGEAGEGVAQLLGPRVEVPTKAAGRRSRLRRRDRSGNLCATSPMRGMQRVGALILAGPALRRSFLNYV